MHYNGKWSVSRGSLERYGSEKADDGSWCLHGYRINVPSLMRGGYTWDAAETCNMEKERLIIVLLYMYDRARGIYGHSHHVITNGKLYLFLIPISYGNVAKVEICRNSRITL